MAKRSIPEEEIILERLQRRHRDWVWITCALCKKPAVTDPTYRGFHPLCYGEPKARTIIKKRRQTETLL